MTENDQKQLGKTLWAVADQLRGTMSTGAGPTPANLYTTTFSTPKARAIASEFKADGFAAA